MKLSTTILGLTAGATLALAPQLVQAQNSIAITGGQLNTSFSYTINTAQGTSNLTSKAFIPIPCSSVCAIEGYSIVSGTGFSPSGPVVFSGVPIVFQIGVNSSILSGAFNSTTVGLGIISQSELDATFSTGGVSGPVSSPDFSADSFSFDTPFAPPTSHHTMEPGGVHQPSPETIAPEDISDEDAPILNRPGRNLRPNGMHTRIFPAWTPGLYQ